MAPPGFKRSAIGAKRQLLSLTLYRCQRLEYIDIDELTKELMSFCKKFSYHLIDYGIHTTGRYGQAHIHALISCRRHSYDPCLRLNGWTYYLQDYVTRSGAYNINCAYWRYIHSDDHASPGKRDNLKVENYHRYHYSII